ncbi:MAG TPA: hypothetical protein VFV50_16385, partial [Bdellovibrionales bacterium]|nr:hypothetical protein [Bdellovibrionales bacterium]
SLLIEVRKSRKNAIEVVPTELKLKPEPLKIVQELMKSGKWASVEKKLKPDQRKYLYSMPQPWDCRGAKPGSPGAAAGYTYCMAGIYNAFEPDAVSFEFMAQAKDDDYLVYVAVWSPVSAAAKLALSTAGIVAESAVILKSERAPAPKDPRGSAPIKLTGYISDEPRFFSSQDKKFQRWTFRVTQSAAAKPGTEYVNVTVHTVRFGKKVGELAPRRGDKVDLEGKFREPANRGKSPLLGFITVNEVAFSEAKRLPAAE